MEDAPAAPSQFLGAKQILTWTSGTSGDKRIDLPRDHIYRMLMFRLWVEGSDVNEVATNIKLTCDTDAFIPFDRKTQQLDAEALEMFGPFSYKHDMRRGGSCTVRVIPNKEPHATPYRQDPGDPCIFVLWAQWSSNINMEVYTHAGALAATGDVTSWVQGHAIHATVPHVFGRMDDPASWFDPTGYGKIEAVLTEGVAAACSIVAEQVRPM